MFSAVSLARSSSLALKATAFSSLGYTVQSRHQSTTSKFILREPPSSASRVAPTPLVFVSSSSWDRNSDKGMTAMSSMFAERGFTTMEIDLSYPPQDSKAFHSSQGIMKHFEDELRAQLRFASASPGPFPPIIFSRSAGALISQTYISSNPASGLVLISPPATNASLQPRSDSLDLENARLPTPLNEFDYEPKFPLAVVGTQDEIETFRKESRLGRAVGRRGSVDLIEVRDGNVEGQEAMVKIEQWLDEIGV